MVLRSSVSQNVQLGLDWLRSREWAALPPAGIATGNSVATVVSADGSFVTARSWVPYMPVAVESASAVVAVVAPYARSGSVHTRASVAA